MMKRLLSLLVILMLLPAASAAGRSSVKFKYSVGMLYVGESYALTPKLKGVTADQLRWETSNPAVLAMEAGTLTGNREGLAAVRASYGNARATCGVVVVNRSISLERGASYSLPYNKKLSYASADRKVASVSSRGVVTGVRAGTAKVAVYSGSVRKVIQVTVTEPQAQQSRAAQLDCADTATQIVLVEHTSGTKATVSFHEKQNGVWTELHSTSGYIGRNGLGKTREGDGKTPTGTYDLTTPFGIKSDPGAGLTYTKVTSTMYWCGDSSSPYYNQLCDSRVNGRKATSADEVLSRYAGVYNYCLFIGYNAEGTPGLGSCIFLHCTGSRTYTAGCVAIPERSMKQAIKWVRAGCKIVIKE